jgi:hypothetical protein
MAPVSASVVDVEELVVSDADLMAVEPSSLAGRSVGINCTFAFFCMITKSLC